MGKFEPIQSFQPDNRLSITCPIFGAQTEIRICFHLRDELWAGRRKDVRRGCQACLHDSKCPIVPILQETFMTGEDPGYFAREPRSAGFQEKHLRRIQNVLVQEKTLNDFGVPDNERAAIASVCGYNAKLKGATLKPLDDVTLPARKPAEKRADALAPTVSTTSVVDAAKTGDLSAAINQATGGEA